jgi:hypothetical protein
MQMIYDSDAYVVLHMPDAAPAAIHDPFAGKLHRHGFEIVDKYSGKEVYLDGSWAEMFQEQINAWHKQTPTMDEIEKTLEGYAALATQPIMVH